MLGPLFCNIVLCVLSSFAIILLKKKDVVAGRTKTCLRRFEKTRADQSAHHRSLISAFVIRLLETSIFNPASSKISIF